MLNGNGWLYTFLCPGRGQRRHIYTDHIQLKVTTQHQVCC